VCFVETRREGLTPLDYDVFPGDSKRVAAIRVKISQCHFALKEFNDGREQVGGPAVSFAGTSH
jgi:hypothetical protein